MSKKLNKDQLEQAEVVFNYLVSAYKLDDVEKLMSSKAVAALAIMEPLHEQYREVVDKVAIFNGIKKASEHVS